MSAYPCKNPSCSSFGSAHPNCKCYGGMAKGGSVESYCAKDNKHKAGCQYLADGGSVLDEPSIQPEQPQPPMTQFPEGKLPSAYSSMPQVAPPTEVLQQVAPQQEAPNDQFNPQGLIKAREQQVAAQNQQLADAKTHYDAINNQVQTTMQDYQNGHIDPQHFTRSMGDGQKVGMALALIAGGIGSAFTGQPNAAMQYLQKQQDLDMEAQKSELGKKHNLLSSNLQLMGNMNQAITMTKLMQNEALASKIDLEATKLQSPMEQQKLQQQSMQLRAQNEMWKQQLATTRASSANGGGNSEQNWHQMNSLLRLTSPEMAKERESRTIPGVGVAQVPVSAEDRKALSDNTDFQMSAKNLLNFAQQHSGSLNPAIIRQGSTMQADLINKFRAATHQGVYKESAKDFDESALGGNPTQFASGMRTKPKVMQMISSLEQTRQQEMKRMGVQPFGGQQQAPQKDIGFKPRK